MTTFRLKGVSRILGLNPSRRAAPDGSGPPGDTVAPSVPQNLVATAVSSSQINLTWDASTDNVAVSGYNIYRDNLLVDTSATNTYADTGRDPGTEYEYEVSAFDAASNESARSAPDSATTHQVIVTNGLVAEWRFDQGTGQVLTDHTGNGHHGQLGSTTGADAADPTWTAQGLSFDGGDFVECDTVGISGGAPRTFIGLVRPGAGGGWAVKWNADGAGQRWCIKNDTLSGNKLRMEYNSGGHTTSNLVVAASAWAFVAVTKSGANANTEIAYVNGSTEAITRDQVLNTTGNFRWGQSGSLSGPTGETCEFAYGLVYNRALSPAEIEQNRQALKVIVAPRGITLP